MKAKIIKPKSHNEWLEERSKGVGSSDAGIVLGVSPFKTPYELWKLKRGEAEPEEETEAMLMGHILESAVVERWQIETGREVVKASAEEWIYVHGDKDYFRASPDRIYYNAGEKHTQANMRILECKTTCHEVDPDNLPKYWIAQVQWLMYVTGMKHASLAWIYLPRRSFGYVDINYNEAFCNWMAGKMEAFWIDNVLGGKEPQLISAKDVAMRYPTEAVGKTLQADGALNGKVVELKQIKANIKALEAKAEKLEDSIKIAMADSEYVESNNGVICSWKAPKPAAKIDYKAMIADMPEVAKKYEKQTQGARRFVIK